MFTKGLLLVCLFCTVLSHAALSQTSPCFRTANQGKVGCTLSNLYSSDGQFHVYQGGVPYSGGVAVFGGSFVDFNGNATALAATLGTELTTLPLTAPGSGFVFQLDKASGLEVRSTQSLGPILAERGETIGRHKLFVAVTYQYFRPTTESGVNTRSLHNVFQHGADQSPNEQYDLISTNDSFDLKIHQVAAFFTFGITDRLDVSALVPILDVRLGASSTATIQNIDPGVSHSFDQANLVLTQTFSQFKEGTGIGDVVFRVKAKVWGGERTKIAFGADVRVPTGDELNFRGSGTYGVRPFAALSYTKSRFAPHANIGLQINGNSILAGLSTGTKAHLPNEVTYSAGTDVGVTHRLTIAADWLGERIINGFAVKQSNCGETFLQTDSSGNPVLCTVGSGGTSAFPESRNYRTSYNVDSISAGAKISPVKNLLITANALFKLDDPGLRSKVVPLVGIGYTF